MASPECETLPEPAPESETFQAPEEPALMRPLKILELKQDSSEVEILVDNLTLISKSLQRSQANLVSIVAVMGAYRTGKSFVLDLLMRYLKHKAKLEAQAASARKERQYITSDHQMVDDAMVPEATAADMEVTPEGVPQQPDEDTWRLGEDNRSQEPPAWVLQGDSQRIAEGTLGNEEEEGFAWRPGKDKCTQGIWLWSSPFVFTDKEGQRTAVLLMDTQGAWDDTMSKAQSATIFGLTALLSSKLIYNIQNRVEEDKLENLDYITTFAQTVCNELPGSDSPFGHLELLVRDWANYEDGFSTKECKAQMLAHLDDHTNPSKVPQDAVPRVERLKSTFRSMGCSGLPHPGLKVTKPKYNGEISLIDGDFLHLLDEFTKDLFGGDFPQPSAPLGCEITVGSFQQIVMNFAEAFRENADDMAIGLREAFVKVEMMTCRDDISKRFRAQMVKFAPESSVIDPVLLKKEMERTYQCYRDEFVTKLKPWRMKEEEEASYVTDFSQTLREAIATRVVQNDREVEGATMKLVASPVVGLTGYFLLVHHIILYMVMAAGGYCHAKKWSVRNNAEMYDPSVFQGIADDVKKWGLQRYKDVQAIQIAMVRFNPNNAMETLMKVSNQAGAIAASAGAAAAAAAQGQPPPGAPQQARPAAAGQAPRPAW